MTNFEKNHQYLSFSLGSELFAINVLQVKEILADMRVTRVPQMPDYMIGVINLRGSVVPVIDLRRKFGMKEEKTNMENCIVVMEVNFSGEELVIGALTDAVREVFDLNDGEIEPPPKMGMKLKTEFIQGLGKQGDEFIIILDIDKIFSGDELSQIQSTEKNDFPVDPVCSLETGAVNGS